MDQNMVETLQGSTSKTPEQAQREQGLRSYINHAILGQNPTPDMDLSSGFIDLTPREKADLLYEKLMAYTITKKAILKDQKADPNVVVEPVDPYLIGEIRTLWQDQKAQDTFVSRFAQARTEARMRRLSELGQDWQNTNEQIATASQVFEQETRRLFLQKVTRPDQISATQGRTTRLAKELIRLREKKEDIFELRGLDQTSENTDIAAAVMFETLSQYHEQADQGFVWLPSRQGIHEQTVASLQNGRWPVLRGEAGTGKSEQADAAAVALTGEQPTHLGCGPNTGYKEMIADKDIDPATGGSYETYQPAMQAATGFIDSRGRQAFTTGRIVRFDESGRLGPRGYTDIKELRQKRPTSRIDVARFERGESIDADKLLHGKPVLPGFAAILTTNPSGARYPDRNEPDAALRRELSYITVDYPPMTAEHPELYEFMLATLMDGNKHIPVAKSELAAAYKTIVFPPERLKNGRVAEGQEVLKEDPTDPEHGILYRLSFAIRALQDAYNFGNYTGAIPDSALRFTTDNDGKIKIAQTGGEPLTLTSSTITLGELSSWMRGFHERKLKDDPNYQVKTLTEWLQLKLNNYLNQADEIDREKIRALFDHFHLFNAAPDLTKEEPLTPKEIGYLSPRVPKPYHLKPASPVTDGETLPAPSRPSLELYQDVMLTLEDGKDISTRPEPIVVVSNNRNVNLRPNSRFLIAGQRFYYAGMDSSGNIVARIDTGRRDEAIHRLITLQELQEQGVFAKEQEAAEQLFGEKFFGPDQIRETWDIDLSADQIPDIGEYLTERGMTEEHLKRAAELGFRFELRINRAKDGSPLTMEKMEKDLKDKFDSNNKGKILYKTSPYDWYTKAPKEPFFESESPEFRWALVSDGVIPGTPDKNYLQQTEVLINYLNNTFFDGQGLPDRYQKAVDEFEAKKTAIAALMTDATWKQAADQLAALKINQITRHTPSEVIYDTIMATWKDANKRYLPNMWTWTNDRSRDGRLVLVGDSATGGAVVGRHDPQRRHSLLGASLSL